ncbi:MAG: bacterial transcriptional activator domain-containing protein [Desulfobulbaceae bacterium]|nr:bacterial transcriptional activator domain-containing protein [Desulfobulbaceae bacterium]
MSALLYGQALADLGRHEDALAHFSDWMPKWQEAEYFFIAALAGVESGWIHLRLGEIDKAKSALQHGHSLIPAKEKILSIYRPVDYVTRLEQTLHSRTIEAQISGKPINIKTLGKFSISVDGCIIDKGQWKGRQSKKLLQAIISLGGRNISTSYLSDILWPDSDGDRAALAFKISLYRLRKVMNTDGSDYPWLVVRHKQISLSSEFCSVDAHIFEEEVRKAYVEPVDPAAIHHTLSLYTGNFLEIEGDKGWHIGRREDLRDSFIRASLRLFDHYKTHNAVKTGLPYLTRALKYDPTNETVLARAIESHLELGNSARAIIMYNDTCHLLEQAHRIGPGKSLQALALKIRGKT